MRAGAIIIALLACAGIVAATYGEGSFGEGIFGIETVAPARGGGGGGGGYAPREITVEPTPLAPVETDQQRQEALVEMPAAPSAPNWLDGLRVAIASEISSLRAEGFRTGSVDRFDEISRSSSDPDTLRTALRNVEAYANDARFSRAALAHTERELQEGIARDRSGITGNVLADVEDPYEATAQLTGDVRVAYEVGDYSLAARLIQGARDSLGVERSRLTLMRFFSLYTLVLFATFLLLTTGVGAYGLKAVGKAAGVPPPRAWVRDLAIVILMCVIVTGSLLAAFGAVWGRSVMNEEREILGAQTDLIEARIAVYLQGISTTGRIMGRAVHDEMLQSGVLHDHSEMDAFLEDTDPHILQFGQSTDTIVGSYVYLNPDAFGEVRYIWYAKEDGEWVAEEDMEVGDPEYLTDADPRWEDPDYAWYFDAVRAGGPTWTKVYTDPDLNVTMISYVGPIFEDGTLLGVWGVDVQFDGVERAIESVDIGYDGFAFLVDDDFNVIGDPALPVPWLEDMRDLLRSDRGMIVHEDIIISYRELANGYRVILVVPRDEIEGITARLNQHYFVLTGAFALVVLGLVIVILRLSAPRDVPVINEDGKGFFGELRRIWHAFKELWKR